jgi:hypothetical protein
MSIVVSTEARICDVKVTADTITAYLVDGRVISVPLAWSWRLSEATPAQRANFEIIGDGQGVHWPDIDEDISAEGMLHGVPARRPRQPVRFIGAPGQSHCKPPRKRLPPTHQKSVFKPREKAMR